MKKDWQKAERQDTLFFHAKPQPLSGRTDFAPGDSISDKFLVETKFTSKESYSVSKKKWQKLYRECVSVNKSKGERVPILSVHLGSLHLVVLSALDLQSLLQTAESQPQHTPATSSTSLSLPKPGKRVSRFSRSRSFGTNRVKA
jgi:hypothetical protein